MSLRRTIPLFMRAACSTLGIGKTALCWLLICIGANSAAQPKNGKGMFKTEDHFLPEIQLTHQPKGHMLNESQCFSKDGRWIVYDTRNSDTGIAENGEIAMVHVDTKEIVLLYKTPNQTNYGPGVGAATFSPAEDRVIFIHGIRNADEKNPYSFTRRTGVSVVSSRPQVPEFMDARDITPPFTPGALRGGTHAHSRSGDGQWLCFTYNDYVLEQLSKKDSSVKDLRVVGVMKSGIPVKVADAANPESNDGKYFSAVVTRVTENPAPGSDEIDKAFDEGWIGTNGYMRVDGSRQQRAIAFQGNTRNRKGETITEVFVVDIPDDITRPSSGDPLQGTERTRPGIPEGVKQRRITFSEKGIQGPRFWLRTSADGSMIGFLAADEKGIIQVFAVSPNGGAVRQLTFNEQSVQGPINFSPDGRMLAYLAGDRVFITDIASGKSSRLTHTSAHTPEGAVIWSPDGRTLAFNRKINGWLQICLLHL